MKPSWSAILPQYPMMDPWDERYIYLLGDSSRDLFIPKRWRSPTTIWKAHVFTIPKRSQRIARYTWMVDFYVKLVGKYTVLVPWILSIVSLLVGTLIGLFQNPSKQPNAALARGFIQSEGQERGTGKESGCMWVKSQTIFQRNFQSLTWRDLWVELPKFFGNSFGIHHVRTNRYHG